MGFYQSLTALVLCLSFSIFAQDSDFQTYHQDKSVKLIVLEDPVLMSSGKNVSEEMISLIKTISNKKSLGINTEGLKFTSEQKSLLGSVIRYSQFLEGNEVSGAELIVSLNKNNEIYKIYNTTTPKEESRKLKFNPSIPLLDQQKAMELAWNYLKVDGSFLELPSIKKIYKKNKSDLELIYQVFFSVTSPYGHWMVEISALSGDLLSIEDETLSRKGESKMTKIRLAGKRVAANFEAEYKKIQNKKSLKALEKNAFSVSETGSARIFSPNPVTTLQNDELEDDSAAEEFELAYITVDLPEITNTDGVYSLEGPKVKLIDFDSPTYEPSTSTDGQWMHFRKDKAFNDAMTYYHIDHSVRYLESLGYVDDKQIFTESLEVDSNGAGGADNSYYIPSQKRLSFGHGCVDDNEDSDVILHELGHAINDHINPSWYGGDTGAMGEGFGDYWAASFSVSQENGLDFKPNWVFKWDGHNDCWGGRVLDALDLEYDHDTTYWAHSRVPGGGVTDELWSTPIFQAYLELYKSGVEREVMDSIIIESQFGLGSGLKMRDLAVSIVQTAKLLYPEEEYDAVYTEKFKHHKIIE